VEARLPDDGNWYLARIDRVRDGHASYLVSFADFGTTAIVRAEDTRLSSKRAASAAAETQESEEPEERGVRGVQALQINSFLERFQGKGTGLLPSAQADPALFEAEPQDVAPDRALPSRGRSGVGSLVFGPRPERPPKAEPPAGADGATALPAVQPSHLSSDLPITRHRDKIIRLIESNQVVIISGSTGSGKTTQVPQYILDEYMRTKRPCNIICTQPRRIAAISIARRVSDERGTQLGSLVGYQVSLDKQAQDSTRLLYVTTGILLQRLVNSKSLKPFTHIIIDEGTLSRRAGARRTDPR